MSNNSFKVRKNLTFSPINPATIESPEPGDVLCDSTDSNKLKKWDGTQWAVIGAESTSASNLGEGAPIFKDVVGADLKFKSIVAETGLYIEEDEEHVKLYSTSPDSAVNIGTGTGIFSQKFGGDLEFKSLKAGSNVTITSTASEITISSSQNPPDLSGKADINSPNFTGTPTAPNPAPESNNNQIATTSFVKQFSGGSTSESLAMFAASNYFDILGSSTSEAHMFTGGAYAPKNSSTNPVYVLVSNARITGIPARYIYSYDGINWLFSSFAGTTGLSFFSIAYGNGRFVALSGTGSSFVVMYSTNATSWTNATNSTSPNSLTRQKIAFLNNMFVALGGGGLAGVVSPRIFTSTDGVTWVLRFSAFFSAIDIAYGNGKFVMIDNSAINPGDSANDVISSDNAVTWTYNSVNLPTTERNTSIAFGNGVFVVVANRSSLKDVGCRVSSDGINWIEGSIPVGFWNTVIFGNGVFLATSTLNQWPRAVISTDGITWKAITIPNRSYKPLTFGGGRFIMAAIDTSKRILTSFRWEE